MIAGSTDEMSYQSQVLAVVWKLICDGACGVKYTDHRSDAPLEPDVGQHMCNNQSVSSVSHPFSKRKNKNKNKLIFISRCNMTKLMKPRYEVEIRHRRCQPCRHASYQGKFDSASMANCTTSQ